MCIGRIYAELLAIKFLEVKVICKQAMFVYMSVYTLVRLSPLKDAVG